MTVPITSVRLLQVDSDEHVNGQTEDSDTHVGELAIVGRIELEMLLFRLTGCTVLGHRLHPEQNMIQVRFVETDLDVSRPRIELWNQFRGGKRKSTRGLWRRPDQPEDYRRQADVHMREPA
jgi:hypothetical protein